MAAVAPDSFVHLHVHTEFSDCCATDSVDALLDQTAAEGMSALAITDHATMAGTYEFWDRARRRGIKPIIGVELNLTAGESRFDLQPRRWGDADDNASLDAVSFTPLTLLAETDEGLRNLFALMAHSMQDGPYSRRARVDHDLLSRHATGIIATTGSSAGAVRSRLRLGHRDEALREAATLREIFGADNLFVELSDHSRPGEAQVLTALLQIGAELGLHPLATNDVHGVGVATSPLPDDMLCLTAGGTLSAPRSERNPDPQERTYSDHYLRSAAHMYATWADRFGVPEACENTVLVAERCTAGFVDTIRNRYLPAPSMPARHDPESWLRAQTWKGVRARYGHTISQGVRERAELELDIIQRRDDCRYFLVAAECVNWAKQQEILVGPAFGVAASSLVCYALGITDIDPLAHGLHHEGFLRPDRPELSVHLGALIADDRRGELIAHVQSKYGADAVAAGKPPRHFPTSLAVHAAADRLNRSSEFAEYVTGLFSDRLSGRRRLAAYLDPEHAEAYRASGAYREVAAHQPDVRQLVEAARESEKQIEMRPFTHKLLIADRPLRELVPLTTFGESTLPVAELALHESESIGVSTLTFVGLSELTTISRVLARIRIDRGLDIVLDSIPIDDPATFTLLRTGETGDMFPLAPRPVTRFLQQVRPRHFDDLLAVIALTYSPLPRPQSHVREFLHRRAASSTKAEYLDKREQQVREALEPLLTDSYGTIIYDEQIRTILHHVAGLTLDEAEQARRDFMTMMPRRIKNWHAAVAPALHTQGFSTSAIESLWEEVYLSASNTYPKAHALSLGRIAYWTAYLKANYPTEYDAVNTGT